MLLAACKVEWKRNKSVHDAFIDYVSTPWHQGPHITTWALQTIFFVALCDKHYNSYPGSDSFGPEYLVLSCQRTCHSWKILCILYHSLYLLLFIFLSGIVCFFLHLLKFHMNDAFNPLYLIFTWFDYHISTFFFNWSVCVHIFLSLEYKLLEVRAWVWFIFYLPMKYIRDSY